jgi:hypothetical protein
MFKIANDAALIFQRTVLRTLGSADMSLLSYALLTNGQQQLFQTFAYLMRTIIMLTFPLATITIVVTYTFHTLATTDLVMIFGVIMTGYMFEMLLSPYERLLEVNFKLKQLALSYSPYCIGYAALVVALLHGKISLLVCIALTQTVRIISSLCMFWYGKNIYQQSFPTLLLGKILSICLAVLFVVLISSLN